ncbi:heme-binding protein [Bradyrhizobium rifense]
MRCGAEPKKRCAVGGLRIKVGNEVVSGIGVSGGPGIDDDEACAKAGIDKISAHLK